MKRLMRCLVCVILVLTFTACGKETTEPKASNEMETLDKQLENTVFGIADLNTETEIKTIRYLSLPDEWTEIASEQCRRLYSENGLAAIVMSKISFSNETAAGEITDMETYVEKRMSTQYVLKLSEPVESEYGNIINKIIVGAGETQEVEEIHYVIISVDGDAVVDIVVVDETHVEELEKFARHISIK